jgi:hypothetical protein
MKKVMFSAIAMIAFVGSGMASDIAAKKVEVADLKGMSISQIDKNNALFLKDCGVAQFSAYVDARAAGFTIAEARGISWNVYFFCVGENSKRTISLQP